MIFSVLGHPGMCPEQHDSAQHLSPKDKLIASFQLITLVGLITLPLGCMKILALEVAVVHASGIDCWLWTS